MQVLSNINLLLTIILKYAKIINNKYKRSDMKIEKLVPAFKDYLWGGNKLKEKYGKKPLTFRKREVK